MKILHVAHGFPPETIGGTERAVQALASAMQRAGHDVTVVAGSLEVAPPARVGEQRAGELRVLRLHRDDLYFESWFKAWAPGVSAAFAELLARERPDVVHVHHWLRLSSDLVRIARAAGCAAVVTLHDHYPVLATPPRPADLRAPIPPAVPSYVSAEEAAEAFAFHRRDFAAEIAAAHVRCAPSRSHAASVQELAPAPLGATQITPPPLLERPARRRAAPGPRKRRLATWGALYPDKGVDTVIDALRQVGGGWSLEVHGAAPDPRYGEEIAQRARGLPVAFHGNFRARDLEEMPADYAVLPSRCHESYGLTLDEALLLGLPVLAADLPVYRERAPASSCAFFTPGDPASLAALLRDEARLQRLTAPPAPHPVTAEAAAQQLLALYARARSAPRTPCDPTEMDRERALLLFRRAERRLWTALQQPDPPAPPPSFLGDA
jgi:glycosyltransferase involved in cell wall biosynthesis